MSDVRGRVLGIDYGSKRVGLALSDPLRMIAGGGGTLANDETLIHNIVGLVGDREVTLVVVGMPFAPDGGMGGKAMEVDQFIQRLREYIQVPITTWDESYSTRDAARFMREGGMKRKQRQQRTGIDEMAARVMLQEFLDQNDAGSNR
jgi:putative holliday junction resolvase